MQLGYSKSCLNTEAFAILVEGWNDLVQEGLSQDGLAVPPITASTECIFAATDEGEIVGALAYEFDLVTTSFTVRLAYVEPSSRRQGVFKLMFEALKARSEPGDKVLFPVAAKNQTALTVLRRFGIVPESVCCLLAA